MRVYHIDDNIKFLYHIGVFLDIIFNIGYLIEFQVSVLKLTVSEFMYYKLLTVIFFIIFIVQTTSVDIDE